MKNSGLVLFLTLLSFSVFGQFRSFKYAAEIEKPTSTWHKIQFEENVLGAAQDDLSDIRIFQVNGNDTAEVSYLFDEGGAGMKKASPLLLPLRKNAFQIRENKGLKQTLIYADFKKKKPVSGIRFNISTKFDYYRRIGFYASMDSIDETNLEEAQLVFSGHISSLEKPGFQFEQVLARYFLIVIENEDNKPLPVKSCEGLYKPVSLVARFDNPGKYFLCYGDPQMTFPDYDLNYFRDKIPAESSVLTYKIIETGSEPEEQTMKAGSADDPAWLWLAVSIIVLLLLIFTLRMLRSKS